MAEPFIPGARLPTDDEGVWNTLTVEVPRTDVEKAIADTLHQQYCSDEDYAGDPAVANADRGGHSWDARLICDELARRGWQVVRRAA
ncbi:hypothetical protein ACFFX1_54870 [Dactylosporangium sucinum]|uniref:Uncharacterized protein n=1 Tax=Dactylosporangium sucinum TaxID=1424081 RepID=A0A917U2V4_9ACTN|nr:hypothetical protein [Dactylosporangium sucinum]GGM53475.1 hypothetical protein GCM10007977_063850 [Dactylosporangium sucinum]